MLKKVLLVPSAQWTLCWYLEQWNSDTWHLAPGTVTPGTWKTNSDSWHLAPETVTLSPCRCLLLVLLSVIFAVLTVKKICDLKEENLRLWEQLSIERQKVAGAGAGEGAGPGPGVKRGSGAEVI